MICDVIIISRSILEGMIKMKQESTQQELAKRLRREYLRQWQRENPDKVKDANERYWMKKAKELTERRE